MVSTVRHPLSSVKWLSYRVAGLDPLSVSQSVIFHSSLSNQDYEVHINQVDHSVVWIAVHLFIRRLMSGMRSLCVATGSYMSYTCYVTLVEHLIYRPIPLDLTGHDQLSSWCILMQEALLCTASLVVSNVSKDIEHVETCPGLSSSNSLVPMLRVLA